MKLSPILLSSLLCAAFAGAQYLSEDGTPGQQQPMQQQPNDADVPPLHAQPTFDPAAETPSPSGPTSPPSGALRRLTSFFNPKRLLTANPVASLIGNMGGVNIPERAAPSAEWDLRIPLITDENFDEAIAYEALSPEEEKERVWFLIISVTADQNNAIHKSVDESFDEAFNQTLIAGDLPNVRWGRIDYYNAPYLTAKWSIYSGPYLVIVTDRGQTLRFYQADRVRVTPNLLRELLIEEHWRNIPAWNTDFAPGGKWEWISDYYASGLMHIFNFVNRFPRLTLIIGVGTIVRIVLRIWRPSPAAPVAPGDGELAADPPAGGTPSESSSAVAISIAFIACTATSTSTASPSRGATTTTSNPALQTEEAISRAMGKALRKR